MQHDVATKVSRLRLRHTKPVRLFEQAVEQIRALIHEGRLKPSDKLSGGNTLSKMLDVSRSSIREALRAFQSKGIVQIRSGAGSFVSKDALVLSSVNDAVRRLMDRRDMDLQILQVRGAMECLSAPFAA